MLAEAAGSMQTRVVQRHALGARLGVGLSLNLVDDARYCMLELYEGGAWL